MGRDMIIRPEGTPSPADAQLLALEKQRAETLAALEEIGHLVAKIEEQLQRETESPERGADWCHRAKRALKHKRVERQTLQNRLGDLNREIRVRQGKLDRERQRAAAIDRARLFVQAAKMVLTGNQFEQIWKTVREMEGNADAA